MLDLGTLGGASSFANAINNHGQVVGYSVAPNNGGGRAFLYSDGRMTDLNTSIPAGSGWFLENATGLNDGGQIAGYGESPSGQIDAFLLTPVPEPTCLSLLTLAGVATLVRRRAVPLQRGSCGRARPVRRRVRSASPHFPAAVPSRWRTRKSARRLLP